MTGADGGQEKLSEEDFLREAIEELGGSGAWAGGMSEFYSAATRLWKEYDELVQKHPDKWVAMGRDGVLAVCDSFDEALSAVEPARLKGSEFIIKYLSSDPSPLIL